MAQRLTRNSFFVEVDGKRLFYRRDKKVEAGKFFATIYNYF